MTQSELYRQDLAEQSSMVDERSVQSFTSIAEANSQSQQQRQKSYWICELAMLVMIGAVGAGFYFGFVQLTTCSGASNTEANIILGSSPTVAPTLDIRCQNFPEMYKLCVCLNQFYQPTKQIEELYDGLQLTFVPNFVPDVQFSFDLSCKPNNASRHEQWCSTIFAVAIIRESSGSNQDVLL